MLEILSLEYGKNKQPNEMVRQIHERSWKLV